MGNLVADEPEVDQKGLVREFASGLGSNLIGKFFGRGTHVLSQIFLANWLGPASFGLFSIGWNILRVIGVVAPNSKTWAYVLSAIFPGIIGVLFFFKNGNVEPTPAFPLHLSIEMIVMVMLGGQGTVIGPILGATGYIGLRGFLLTTPIFKNIQLSVAGAVLLLIVLFVPAGLIGWVRNRYPKLRRVLQ